MLVLLDSVKYRCECERGTANSSLLFHDRRVVHYWWSYPLVPFQTNIATCASQWNEKKVWELPSWLFDSLWSKWVRSSMQIETLHAKLEQHMISFTILPPPALHIAAVIHHWWKFSQCGFILPHIQSTYCCDFRLRPRERGYIPIHERH